MDNNNEQIEELNKLFDQFEYEHASTLSQHLVLKPLSKKLEFVLSELTAFYAGKHKQLVNDEDEDEILSHIADIENLANDMQLLTDLNVDDCGSDLKDYVKRLKRALNL